MYCRRRNRLVILVLLMFFCSIVLPLATYSISLIVFGLPHVFTELRYLDSSFSNKIAQSLHQKLGILLLFIALIRIIPLSNINIGGMEIIIELVCVVALLLVVAPTLDQRSELRETISLLICSLIILGILFTPTLTLLFFAFAHNFTPIGFLLQKLKGKEKIDSLKIIGVFFLVMPVLILTGLPQYFLLESGWILPHVSCCNLGSLEQHLGVYVPEFWQGKVFGYRLFSTAVFLQCMHYAIVLKIFSQWTKEQKSNLVYFAYLKSSFFNALVIGLSFWLFIQFLVSFNNARLIYGVFASIHAWIEIPLLLYDQSK